MIGSLYTGISGLNANATAMQVIGDNIANVNTSGFKSSRASFANVLSQSISGSSGNEIGRGVRMSGTTSIWTQGTMESTGKSTDLAINGGGMFMVREESGENYYTRAGEFYFNEDDTLVNPDGLVAQGYEVNPDGSLGAIGDITVSSAGSPPNETTELNTSINLNADAQDGETYSNSITVFDSLGNDVTLTLDFTYDSANAEWDWNASTSDGACATTGSLAFDPTGELDPASSTPSGSEPTINITGLSTGANDMSVTWDYLEGGASNGSITGYASESTTTFQSQDGYPAGTLQGIFVDEDGFVTGQYSNGELDPLYQIALADFPSYEGLAPQGDNLYAESLESGAAMPGTPGSGGLGKISPNSLEMSNVDLADEFVKMITTQKAFQANSKVIKTSDEILTSLINIKR